MQTVAEEDDIIEEFMPVGLNSASLDLSHLSVTQQEELHAIIPAELFLRRNQGQQTLWSLTSALKRVHQYGRECTGFSEEVVALILDLEVTEPSTSEWSNPIVMVKIVTVKEIVISF